IIASAESKVHSAPVGEVHFHELGMLDAVVDIVISSYLFDKLSIDKIVVSPVNVGDGTVKMRSRYPAGSRSCNRRNSLRCSLL
ncbi:MAG: LarC family nickel insertion protein, partial [Clostridiales bacterium]|nr:LarC family nickel insertion protein [Clostridiales bacterium]